MAQHVITVDDCKTMRDMVAFTLKRAAFRSARRRRAEGALRPAHRNIGLIITDLNMPVMDGVGLIRTVRQDAKHRACRS